MAKRVTNTIRVLLLGGLIATGYVAYQDRNASAQNDSVRFMSLIPSPVSVTVLSSPSSQASSEVSPAGMSGQATSPRG